MTSGEFKETSKILYSKLILGSRFYVYICVAKKYPGRWPRFNFPFVLLKSCPFKLAHLALLPTWVKISLLFQHLR